MSLDPPTYLASLQSNIRQRPIPWDGAVRAGTLTEEHYNKIRAVDKAKKSDERKKIVDADVEGYRLLFVGGSGKPSVLESAAQHANVIQYILVLLSDLLDGKCCRVKSLNGQIWERSFMGLLASGYADRFCIFPCPACS
jgi:V-type H+-transporting ATPase subunit H